MVLSSLRRCPQVSTHRLSHAEHRLTERYVGLVRLAYLVLPPSVGRHRRVLLAHSLVQRILPVATPGVPAPRGGEGGSSQGARSLYVPVLRQVLALSWRPPGWPGRFPAPRMLPPRLPVVLALRLFPGGADELALSRALSELSATARAAFALLRVERLAEAEARDILESAGFADVEAGLRAVLRLDATLGISVARVLTSEEFDPCTVRARPNDPLRRRRRVRLAGGAVLAALVTAVVPPACAGVPATSAAGPGAHRPPRTTPMVGEVVQAAPDAWAAASRVDFTAWPARGEAVHDRALLRRALAAWAGDDDATRVTRAAGTSAGPPLDAPHLLYAGPVDGRTVVLLHDGQRLARYSESVLPGGRSLALARVDGADVTTAAAVTLSARGGAVRYLLAPWVAEAQTRDLTRPNVPARRLGMFPDGLTAPVPLFAAGGGCGRRTVLQLRSSSRIAEHPAFLLAGLGDMTLVHLTYTPLPGHGAPARQPREATGPAALLAWAREACAVASLRGGGVRALNASDFAERDLPDGAGHAVWTCSRIGTWSGPVTWRSTGTATAAVRCACVCR
ncbi:hypothetical protein ACGFT2_33810 [Streptomyces sp. NPDC048514]|uniref:hypothetical protein n=1 Tax=Streptomyces sp. NPDC048514 TaxID=3365564 RepID=UPI00371A7C8D